MSFTSILLAVPPGLVYALVGLFVGLESVGVPVPGEAALVAGALLSSHPDLHVSALGIGLGAFAGAVAGDSIGYAVGRRFGPRLIDGVERRFPRQVSPEAVAYAGHLFTRYGMGAVFVGRFVALLRVLSGPLSGSLGLPYGRFLLANAAGAAVWAGGLTAVVHLLGAAAHRWISGIAWGLLAALLLAGIVGGRLARDAWNRKVAEYARACGGAGGGAGPASTPPA